MSALLLLLAFLIGVSAALSLLPPPRSRPVGWVMFFFTGLINEQPYAALAVTGGAAAHAVLLRPGTPFATATVGVAALNLLLLCWIARRAGRVEAALKPVEASLGIELPRAKPRARSYPARLLPVARIPRGVERLTDVRYGPSSSDAHLMDIYRPRNNGGAAPVFVHWHGGAFRAGGKSREALPLLYRLASAGFFCVSPNYRLIGEAAYPACQVDAKRVLAWLRGHGREFGADPRRIVVAGSSAGGHIASMCGLTQNDPRFQPGFESSDTSVMGVVSLYGYYGPYDWRRAHAWAPQDPLAPWAQRPTAPLECDGRQAPPFLIVHGDHDGIVPAWLARAFVAMLRSCSSNPVIYAELPGARHAFDTLPSVRLDAVTNAVELFSGWATGAPPLEHDPAASKGRLSSEGDAGGRKRGTNLAPSGA